MNRLPSFVRFLAPVLILCSLKASEAKVVEGQLTINTFRKGALTESSMSDIELEIRLGAFAIGTIEKWPGVVRHNLTISDYDTTFESRVVILSAEDRKKHPDNNNGRVARAGFHQGSMPKYFDVQAGVTQILALAINIINKRDIAIKGGILGDEYFPRFLAEMIVSVSKCTPRAFVKNLAAGGVRVEFWGTDNPRATEGSQIGEGGFRIGELEIESVAEGLPTQLYYATDVVVRVEPGDKDANARNILRLKNGQTLKIVPATEFIIKASRKDSPTVDLFSVSAFRPGETVTDVNVVDTRFKERIGYTLKPKTAPPFRANTTEYSKVVHDVEAMREEANETSLRTKILLAVFVAIPVLGILIYIAKFRRVSGKQDIKNQ